MFRRLLYSAFGLLGSRETTAFEKETLDVRASQTSRLLDILAPNIATIYGNEHGFASIKTISDFQKAVPINVYDSIHPYIERAADGEQNILTAEQPFMFAT